MISQLKKRGGRKNLQKASSRGSKLKAIEDQISCLDKYQSKAVIETVEGVQRIRGLAGSGKTIVLALKVAYLYTMYENKMIAVTFNSRALKGQFIQLITNFIVENTNEEPDCSISNTPMLFIMITKISATSPLSISLLSFMSYISFLFYWIFPHEIIVLF